jgi:hypothetical protein
LLAVAAVVVALVAPLSQDISRAAAEVLLRRRLTQPTYLSLLGKLSTFQLVVLVLLVAQGMAFTHLVAMAALVELRVLLLTQLLWLKFLVVLAA